ncbi:MAG: response regulator [Elusimicrobia bacterium]|nr:response regulator [Elusimicrobiota bacterium]
MNARRILILLTDDDENLRGLMKDTLSMEGYEIEEARDGVQCLEKAQANRPTVILMDIDMPNMNGLEACRRIKASPETKDIPVIFISTNPKSEAQKKAIDVGGAYYFQKPVSEDELMPLLKKLAGEPV